MKKQIFLFIAALVLVVSFALMGSGCSKAKQAEKEWQNAGSANSPSTPAETPAPEKPAEAPKQ